MSVPSALASESTRQTHALTPIERDVERGLSSTPKTLPPYLFYDDEGSRLYEQITELPEYYPTRTERAILRAYADDIVRQAAAGTSEPLKIVELGAGTASKTRWVLDAVVRRQGHCSYVPIDVSSSALDAAKSSLEAECPAVEVQPFHGQHEEAFDTLHSPGSRPLVLFIGSSIGNFDDPDAISLLRGVGRALSPGGALLLGTDLIKSPDVLVPAYDDAAGVTAAFNKNLLTRLNRELDARFDLTKFKHVALWNAVESRIEMHLESTCKQYVQIDKLALRVELAAGERIHTESSIKYSLPRVERLLRAAGFLCEKTFQDPEQRFAVHLARVTTLG